MKLYRYSPIKNKSQLTKAIKHIHFECQKLCKQSLDEYLPVSGNIGVFCHYDDEYRYLSKMRKELTNSDDNFNQKYYRLRKPISFSKEHNIPEATYTYLYIRHPDPYRYQVGDVDFYANAQKYTQLKELVKNGNVIKGARFFPRSDLDMIELFDPDVDCCAYITNHQMST